MLLQLIRVNAQPENIAYRYDYFRDNCAMRPRDVLVPYLSIMRLHGWTASGHRAYVGVMCYEALVHVAYYEAYDERAEGPGKYAPWDGQIPATANASQLRRAQAAWRTVIRANRYRLL